MERSDTNAEKKKKATHSSCDVLPISSDKLHPVYYQPAPGIRPTPLPHVPKQSNVRMVHPISGSILQQAQNYLVCYSPSVKIPSNSQQKSNKPVGTSIAHVLQSTPVLERRISVQSSVAKVASVVSTQTVVVPSATTGVPANYRLNVAEMMPVRTIAERLNTQTSLQYTALPSISGFTPSAQGIVRVQLPGANMQVLKQNSAPNLRILDLPMDQNPQLQTRQNQAQKMKLQKVSSLVEISSLNQDQFQSDHYPGKILSCIPEQENPNLSSSMDEDVLSSYYLQTLLNVQNETAPPSRIVSGSAYHPQPLPHNIGAVTLNHPVPPGDPGQQNPIPLNDNSTIFNLNLPTPSVSTNLKPAEKILKNTREVCHKSSSLSESSLQLNNTTPAKLNVSYPVDSSSSLIPVSSSYTLSEKANEELQEDENEVTTEIFDCHSMVLLDKLNQFRNKGEYCDLAIEIGKSQWKCHLNVITAMCPLLQNLIRSKSFSEPSFMGGMTIKLPQKLNENGFSLVLDMLYTGRISLSKRSVRDLLLITAYLKLSMAQSKCEQYFENHIPDSAEELERIYSTARKLPKPAFCTNEVPEPCVNGAVMDVVSDSFQTAQDTEIHTQGLGNKRKKLQILQKLDSTTDGMSSTGISSRTLEIDVTDGIARNVVCGSDEDAHNDVSSLDMISLQNIKEQKTSDENQAEPNSSLTNLIRVASEAYEDLDHEVKNEEEIEIVGRKRRKIIDDGSTTDVDDKSFPETNEDEEWDEISCKVCKRSFATPGGLTAHMRRKHKKKCHVCRFCPKTFSKNYDRKIHEQRIHTKEKPFTCTHCGKGFHLNRELQHHVKNHQGGYMHGCSICEKTFQSEAGYKLHMASHGEKKFVCCHAPCKRSFANLVHLKRHERSHSSEKPFQCEMCENSFKSNHELVRHRKTHTGEKPFKCEVCKKGFSRAEHLRVHKSTHTEERNFKCSDCGRTFKQKSGLNLHKHKHFALNFVCDICGYKCHTKSRLKGHSLSHSSERPFECDICAAPFKAKKYLTRHKKMHESKGETDAEKYKEQNRKKRGNKQNMLMNEMNKPTLNDVISSSMGKSDTTILPKLFNIISPHSNLQHQVVMQSSANYKMLTIPLSLPQQQTSSNSTVPTYLGTSKLCLPETSSVNSTITKSVEAPGVNFNESENEIFLQYENIQSYMTQNTELHSAAKSLDTISILQTPENTMDGGEWESYLPSIH